MRILLVAMAVAIGCSPHPDAASHLHLVIAEDLADESTTKVLDRIASIKAELATTGDHPWAGEYYAGDGLGMNLRLWIAPQAGVAYQWHGCLGLYEQNLGSVRLEDGQLLLDWGLFQNDSYVTDSNWVAIRWQKSLYLVPTVFVHQFCISARARGTLPMLALQSEVMADTPADTEPQLPAKFQVYRDLPPIEPRVVSAGKSDRIKVSDTMDKQTQEVIVDRGSNQHVMVGMRFEARYPKRPDWILTINDVRPDSASGTLRVNRKPSEPSVTPHSKWRFYPASW